MKGLPFNDSEGITMKVAVQLSKRAELKALPILLRHSPGMMLEGGTYVIDVDAARALKAAGIKFKALALDANPPELKGGNGGERV
jgi:hypothetical protein